MQQDHNIEFVPVGPLTFVFYRDEDFSDIVAAHCLELDLGGQGATVDEARTDLQSAIETYVLHYAGNREPIPMTPAPAEFSEYKDRSKHVMFLVVAHAATKKKRIIRRTARRTRASRVVFADMDGRFMPEATAI